jgi:hypothetical protein
MTKAKPWLGVSHLLDQLVQDLAGDDQPLNFAGPLLRFIREAAVTH